MATPIPLPVDRALQRLGHSLSLARRRRQLSQQDLATRIGASVNTVRRMEEGYPGTAIQHIARALQVFGELGRLEELLDTPHDMVGLALMDEKLPKRVRSLRSSGSSGDGAF
ncbi:helix-turn-helix domain-containing protein [Malikia granosa]|uniref:Transcriptional regulator n=1 Tax=Malikia granosa TaxID=263067 RepID=A0A2S9K0I1_9BURK|nr:helix-turn-helix transcriptional regulator [Malikia granosa]PRD63929.1 transcriptional regulator [Malikia granosa]